MARIPMINTFTIVPEGYHIFRIYDATYDETFGKLEVYLVTAQGLTHKERFSILDNNDQVNEKALAAFSHFAKIAMQDFSMEDVAPEELIGKFIEAEVVHTHVPSNQDPNKTITFANLGDKKTADYFDEEAVAKALTLGRASQQSQPEKQAEKPRNKALEAFLNKGGK